MKNEKMGENQCLKVVSDRREEVLKGTVCTRSHNMLGLLNSWGRFIRPSGTRPKMINSRGSRCMREYASANVTVERLEKCEGVKNQMIPWTDKTCRSLLRRFLRRLVHVQRLSHVAWKFPPQMNIELRKILTVIAIAQVVLPCDFRTEAGTGFPDADPSFFCAAMQSETVWKEKSINHCVVRTEN